MESATFVNEIVQRGLNSNWLGEYGRICCFLSATWIRLVTLFRGDEYALLSICSRLMQRRMEADTLRRLPPQLLNSLSFKIAASPSSYKDEAIVQLFEKALFFAQHVRDSERSSQLANSLRLLKPVPQNQRPVLPKGYSRSKGKKRS